MPKACVHFRFCSCWVLRSRTQRSTDSQEAESFEVLLSALIRENGGDSVVAGRSEPYGARSACREQAQQPLNHLLAGGRELA